MATVARIELYSEHKKQHRNWRSFCAVYITLKDIHTYEGLCKDYAEWERGRKLDNYGGMKIPGPPPSMPEEEPSEKPSLLERLQALSREFYEKDDEGVERVAWFKLNSLIKELSGGMQTRFEEDKKEEAPGEKWEKQSV